MAGQAPFEFIDDLGGVKADFIGTVPPGIASKEALLHALYEALSLPGWFGFNWDALSDCLRDFHWMDHHDIAVVHHDVPALPGRELRAYVDVLADAVESWQPNESHRLIVVFPTTVEQQVRQALKNQQG